MKRTLYFALLSALVLVAACAKEEPASVAGVPEIRAVFAGGDSRVGYSDVVSGGNVFLHQEWQVGDRLIGSCDGRSFRYVVSEIDHGTATLRWSAGYELSGTETDVRMYYATGLDYTDISPEGVLQVDVASQDADAPMPATMAAVGDFSNGVLTLPFSNMASVLRLDRLCWLPAGGRVSAVRISGAVSGASLSGTSWSGAASSAITLTKQGGWDIDASGEMTDTLRVVLLPSSSSASLTVKAVVGGTEYTVYRTSLVVKSGRYYYSAPVGARMVSDGNATYYADVREAVEAANGSASDAVVTMFSDYSIASGDSLRFQNASGKKITLDFGNSVLTGQNTIFSEVEFTASGNGCAKNVSSVVVIRHPGKFTLKGTSLTSTSTSGDNTAAPLRLYGESGSKYVYATIEDAAVTGNTTYGAAYIFRGTLTVNEGGVLSSKRAAFVSTYGTLTVNGGSLTSTSSQCIHVGMSSSKVNVNGGTFVSAANLLNFNNADAAAAAVKVAGGKFSWASDFWGTNAGTKTSVSGGLFCKKIPVSAVASGCECVSNTDVQTKSEYPYTVK